MLNVTAELVVIGGAASLLVEIMRALLLDLNRYPRLKMLWPLLPALFGIALALGFPSAVPGIESPLLLGAHGFFSPLAFYLAYPVIKRSLASKASQLLSSVEGDKDKELPS